MRHRRHKTRLHRTTEHRTALMRNLAAALIRHEMIKTTEVKAKQLRQFIERIVTIAKHGVAANDDSGVTLAKRRLAFSHLNDKETVKKLFSEIAPRVVNRPGGYTRIVKSGRRAGDGAPMAYIEFVDRVVAIPEVDAPAKSAKKKAPKKEKNQAAPAEA